MAASNISMDDKTNIATAGTPGIVRHIGLVTDTVFCLLLLPLMVFAFPVERLWGTHPVFFSLFILWLYASYFIFRHMAVPKLFKGRKERITAAVAICASVGITFLFSSYEISSPYYNLFNLRSSDISFPVWGIRQNQQAVWLHYIVVVVFSFAVGATDELYRQKMARKEIEYERNRAELSLYRAQINPHFLFNTLNTIYGLLITHSDRAVPTMERFINLTKYMYDNSGKDLIPVAEEIDYIGQYIELQKLRLGSFASVSFSSRISDSSCSIPPMMLITFVENAFKYGISPDEPCFVDISLEEDGGTVRFRVANTVFNTGADSRRSGIANCRRRLELLYPGRHRLDAGPAEDGTFKVYLEINTSGS